MTGRRPMHGAAVVAIAFALAGACAPRAALAQAGEAERAMPWRSPDGGDDARPPPPVPPGVHVPAWQELDPQQQRDLAAFADRWDRMPASRRVLVLERYQRWTQLPPARRDQLRAGERNFRHLSPAQRERMRRSFRAMRALPPEEQQRLRARWRAMSPEQRRDWLERGGPGLAPP